MNIAPDAELVQRVLAVAGMPLRFAIRLAEVTGQHPGDVLRMGEQHISGAPSPEAFWTCVRARSRRS